MLDRDLLDKQIRSLLEAFERYEQDSPDKALLRLVKGQHTTQVMLEDYAVRIWSTEAHELATVVKQQRLDFLAGGFASSAMINGQRSRLVSWLDKHYTRLEGEFADMRNQRVFHLSSIAALPNKTIPSKLEDALKLLDRLTAPLDDVLLYLARVGREWRIARDLLELLQRNPAISAIAFRDLHPPSYEWVAYIESMIRHNAKGATHQTRIQTLPAHKMPSLNPNGGYRVLPIVLFGISYQHAINRLVFNKIYVTHGNHENGTFTDVAPDGRPRCLHLKLVPFKGGLSMAWVKQIDTIFLLNQDDLHVAPPGMPYP